MQEAIRNDTFTREERVAVLSWLNKHGPFWDDVRRHAPEDYFEIESRVVTDTAIGEVAYRCCHGAEHHLVSFTPSSWEYTPVVVQWHLDDEETREVRVPNHWDTESLEATIRSAPEQWKSWKQLDDSMQRRFENIKFANNCFHPLHGCPFIPAVAEQISMRLHVLDQYQSNLDKHGKRTPEAQRIFNMHFMGDRALFSDSSATEKRDFKKDMTFPHPDPQSAKLFCPWHGKVSTGCIRLHFSWPKSASEHLYVVYVGPKITKK